MFADSWAVHNISGVINNMKTEEKMSSITENLTLFGNKGSASEISNLNKVTKTGIKRAVKNFENITLASSLNISKDPIKTTKELVKSQDIENVEVLRKKYEELDDYEKLKIEEKAIKICCM